MLGDMIAALSNWMYTYLLVILLIAAGLFFTVRNRFPQLRLLRESIRVVVERPEKEGSVSSFQALMVSTASRVGTGNIIGVSVAICIGGYGAVFWMWLIALIGGATAFTESTLAQIYKRRNPETGESYGGPAYYIEAALHSKPLAVLFALSLIATYAGGFNMLCSYNLQSTFSGYGFYNAEITPWVIGGVVALHHRLLRHGRRQADHRLCLHPGAHHGRPLRAGGPGGHHHESGDAAPGVRPHLRRRL